MSVITVICEAFACLRFRVTPVCGWTVGTVPRPLMNSCKPFTRERRLSPTILIAASWWMCSFVLRCVSGARPRCLRPALSTPRMRWRRRHPAVLGRPQRTRLCETCVIPSLPRVGTAPHRRLSFSARRDALVGMRTPASGAMTELRGARQKTVRSG